MRHLHLPSYLLNIKALLIKSLLLDIQPLPLRFPKFLLLVVLFSILSSLGLRLHRCLLLLQILVKIPLVGTDLTETKVDLEGDHLSRILFLRITLFHLVAVKSVGGLIIRPLPVIIDRILDTDHLILVTTLSLHHMDRALISLDYNMVSFYSFQMAMGKGFTPLMDRIFKLLGLKLLYSLALQFLLIILGPVILHLIMVQGVQLQNISLCLLIMALLVTQVLSQGFLVALHHLSLLDHGILTLEPHHM